MFRRRREEIKFEGLMAQLNLFAALENRHTVWADDTFDPEIERVHLEIIELIRQTRKNTAFFLRSTSKIVHKLSVIE